MSAAGSQTEVPPGWRSWAGILALTAAGFFWFPGNDFLRSDSVLYVPILERLQNPLLLGKDIVATRPFQYSAYGATALVLTSYTPLPLKRALQVELFAFLGIGLAGVFLIALTLGLPPVGAWFVAAIYSLPLETEPIPRVFARASILLAVGLAARGRPLAAGCLGALAFLYHPITALPFAIAVGIVVLRRTLPWTALATLAAGPVLLLALAHSGTAVTAEMPDLLHRLDADEEAFQRVITPLIFVSEWQVRTLIECTASFAAGCLAWWTLRERLRGRLELLVALMVIGAASIPASWLTLEAAGFPQIQPARAVPLMLTVAGVLCAGCAWFAAEQGQWIRTGAWLVAATILPFEGSVVTWFVTPATAVAAVALPAAMTAGLWLRRRTRGISVIAAGLLPLIAVPACGLVNRLPNYETRGLDEVAGWARQNTSEDAVFLFPDSGKNLQPSVFRAVAERAVYIDWRSRGQANYFPGFEAEWRRRWADTNEGNWLVTAGDLEGLRTRGVDYVVVRAGHSIAGLSPVVQNAEFVVYSVR
jgi:hypothetical protein